MIRFGGGAMLASRAMKPETRERRSSSLYIAGPLEQTHNDDDLIHYIYLSTRYNKCFVVEYRVYIYSIIGSPSLSLSSSLSLPIPRYVNKYIKE